MTLASHSQELPQMGPAVVLLPAAAERRRNGAERLGIKQVRPALVDLRQTRVVRQPGQGAVLRALERLQKGIDRFSESNSALPS
ncbi:MAG TPA: hypothetical protein VMN39_05865 [Longimicrobiaceae bacterium]|nr:hypothetical protein [Longimicrobiaceae bacterium]